MTGCGRPAKDVLLLCATCLWGLECDLGDVGAVIEAANETMARLSASVSIDGSRSAERPLPIHAGVYEAKLTLETQLVGWVRDLAERHGEEDNLPRDDMGSIAAWLLSRVYRIATHPAAEDIHAEITASVEKLRRFIDLPPDREFVGVCNANGCPGWLYVAAGASNVTCRECGTRHDADESWQRVMDVLEGRLMTTREIAGLATHHGIDRRRAMKLMGTWADRGRLVAAGRNRDGEPLYPFGSMLDMLKNTPIRTRSAS